jgi:predicted DNA-binding transcriptional regulator
VTKADELRHDVAMSDTGKKSQHEVKVWLALRDKPDQWLTNSDIARESGVKVRTARQYTLRLFKQGVLERTETFPEYRYQLAPRSAVTDAYRQRIEAAMKAFGLGSNHPL